MPAAWEDLYRMTDRPFPTTLEPGLCSGGGKACENTLRREQARCGARGAATGRRAFPTSPPSTDNITPLTALLKRRVKKSDSSCPDGRYSGRDVVVAKAQT